MSTRGKVIWIVCAVIVYTWAVYSFARPKQTAAAPGVTDKKTDVFLAEAERDTRKGRYQLVSRQEGVIVFDTATAEMWRITSGQWEKIPLPREIQDRQTSVDSKDPLGLFPKK